MTESIGSMPAGATAPSSILALLGARPLIRGEDAASYDELLVRICGTLRPADSLEEIWIRDVVDLVWDTFRLRRIKANMLTHEIEWHIGNKLRHERPDDAQEMARAWACGDDDAASYVPAALTSVGTSIDKLLAESMRSRSGDVERLDRMLVSAEARRSAALRELDYHRGPLARKLRRAIAEAEQSEFTADAPRIAAQAQPA
jgi:hypothetical protein